MGSYGTASAQEPALAKHGALLDRWQRPYGSRSSVARLCGKETPERNERNTHRIRRVRRRILDGVSDPGPTGTEAPRSRPMGPLIGAAVWVVGSAVAFAVLDPIIAAFVCILGLTAVVMAFLASL